MWISQSEAARQVNVTKQRINTLVTQGRLTHNEKKQVLAKDVLRFFARDTEPAWDEQSTARHARAEVEPAEPDSPSLREARVEQIKLDVERKQFELERQRGLYVPRADVDRAMESAGRLLGQQIDMLPHMADEVYAAARDGSAADVRRLLKEKARQCRQALADAMSGKAAQEDDADGA